MRIEAKGVHYRALNEQIHNLIDTGEKEIILNGVNGQRYIGCGIKREVRIAVNGIPGNDMGAFMDGPHIAVSGNAEDGIGNTMSAGTIIIHGDAGDITGYSMRGGKIYIKGNAGYRVGIHMKSYRELHPVIIVGGSVRDFLGEYMAGGLLIVLGNNGPDIAGNYIGTGMHGGAIYINGKIEDWQLGKEVKKFESTEEDIVFLSPYLKEYCRIFSLDAKTFEKIPFTKLIPLTHRPYGRLYAY
jgi:glutamate synthase domain-containing protein 3